MGSLREIIILLLVVSMILNDSVAERRRVSREEYLKYKKRLEFLNRPAVKSFQNKDGNTIDCVDIYKQPSLDHPLLKNSTIQMKPSSLPEGMNIKASLGTTTSWFIRYNQSCPVGTIPIRRTRMEDLLRFDNPFDFGKKLGPNNPQYAYVDTMLKMTKNHPPIFGGHGRFNVWQPQIANDYGHVYSLSEMKFYKGPVYYFNTIEVGWLVYPQLYNDPYPHLFVYWTVDSYRRTGCFDLTCPGFVQVSNQTVVGSILQPVSIYDGIQMEISVFVFQAQETNDWWLVMNTTHEGSVVLDYVGYWDHRIFTGLTNGGADDVSWGGEVGYPRYQPRTAMPPMGSGHFPVEGAQKACYLTDLVILTIGADGKYVPSKLPPDCCDAVSDWEECYRMDDYGDLGDNFGHTIFFGGPPSCDG